MGQQKLDFRGGRREGSGRKKIGSPRRVSLTLSEEHWKIVEQSGATISEAIRNIIGVLEVSAERPYIPRPQDFKTEEDYLIALDGWRRYYRK